MAACGGLFHEVTLVADDVLFNCLTLKYVNIGNVTDLIISSSAINFLLIKIMRKRLPGYNDTAQGAASYLNTSCKLYNHLSTKLLAPIIGMHDFL